MLLVSLKDKNYIHCKNFDNKFYSLYLVHLLLFDDVFFRCKEKYPYMIHILHGLTHTARTGSVYITMAITIERYFATVHPFKRFEVKKILLIGSCLFAIIYNIPKVS